MSRRASHTPLIEARDISYEGRLNPIEALDIPKGFTVIHGRNGSGKTTLGSILHGLTPPHTGVVTHTGTGQETVYLPRDTSPRNRLVHIPLLETLAERQAKAYRAKYLGSITQIPYANPDLTVRGAILLHHAERGVKVDPDYFEELVDRFEMGNKLNRRTHELSGGEQQRISIISAFVHKPALVFADELTAPLDTDMGLKTFNFLRHVTRQDTSVIAISHEGFARDFADYALYMQDGNVATFDPVSHD